jgi:hypothetical protein
MRVKKQLIDNEITRILSDDIPTFHSRPGSTALESALALSMKLSTTPCV